MQPVWGLGKQRVGTAIHHVRQRLPFPLRSLHTPRDTAEGLSFETAEAIGRALARAIEGAPLGAN